jgi:hypothetical protein
MYHISDIVTCVHISSYFLFEYLVSHNNLPLCKVNIYIVDHRCNDFNATCDDQQNYF